MYDRFILNGNGFCKARWHCATLNMRILGSRLKSIHDTSRNFNLVYAATESSIILINHENRVSCQKLRENVALALCLFLNKANLLGPHIINRRNTAVVRMAQNVMGMYYKPLPEEGTVEH